MSEVPTRLLRETLRSATTPESSPKCLDAETLAAWADGALSARGRAAAESHASTCARCQALLAAMVRTLPPAPERKWWQASTFGWLVPIVVGAIAVVVWINVPVRDQRSAAAPPAATSPSGAPAASADRPEARAELRDPARSSPPAAFSPRRPAISGEARKADVSPAPKSTARSQPPASAESEPARLVQAPPPAAAAEPALATPPPPPSQNATTSQLAAGAPAAPATAAPPTAAPMASAPVYDQMSAGARAQTMAKTLAGPVQIVSPNPSVRWRIVAPGRVDRSIDGGTTWQTQPAGVPVMLTAGAAPSPTVCWLVGPGGTVVISIDGRRWQRVGFPETIDLASVRATDAVSATVTAVDGRTFVTSDGGRSWRTP